MYVKLSCELDILSFLFARGRLYSHVWHSYTSDGNLFCFVVVVCFTITQAEGIKEKE